MAGAIIKSVLKETINELPDDFAMKSQSIVPWLKKKGVKDEELEFSGVKIPEGKVTKEDLLNAEAQRKDKFDVVDGDKDYQSYSLENAKHNPTYREKILTYDSNGPSIRAQTDKFRASYSNREDDTALAVASDLGYTGNDVNGAHDFVMGLNEPGSRYTSTHFPEVENYLAHTRIYDDVIDGKATRVLQEIQSDLHQDARKAGGYSSANAAEVESAFTQARSKVKAYLDSYDEDNEHLFDAAEEAIEKLNSLLDEPIDSSDYEVIAYATREEVLGESSHIPKSPQEKTWLVKGIERELVDAVNDGKEQLVIPIKGGMTSNLYRAPGVQKWYETQVLSTAKKVAKRAGADFEVIHVSKTKGEPITADKLAPALEGYKKYLDKALTTVRDKVEAKTTVANNLMRNSGISSGKAFDIAEGLMDKTIATPEDFVSALQKTGEMNQYAVIKPDASAAIKEVEDQQAVLDPLYSRLDELDKQIETSGATPELEAEKSSIYKQIGEFATAQAMPEETTNKLIDRTFEIQSELGKSLKSQGYGDFLSDRDIQDLSTYEYNTLLTPEQKSLVKEYTTIQKTISEAQGKKSSTKFNADKIQFNLYSSPAAGGFAVYMAYTQGYTEEEVTEQLLAKGKTQEEVDKYLKTAEAVKAAKEAGYTDEEIKSTLEERYKPAKSGRPELPEYMKSEAINRWASGNVLSPKNKSMTKLLSEEAETAKDLLSNMKTIKPTLTSHVTDVAAFFGNQEAMSRHNAARLKSREEIIRLMKAKYDVDLAWEGKDVGSETWQILNKQGEVEEITPGFWDDLSADTGEILGAVGGFALGFKAAPITAPYVGPLSKPLAGVAGGIAGAIVGSELDYIKSAVELQEDLEAEAMAYTALNASEMAIIGEVLGYGVVKALGVGWKGLVRAKDMIMDGNTEGAYQALKETANYSDSEIQELVSRLENVMNIPGKNEKEKGIAAVAITEPGMQDLARAAGTVDAIASKRIIDSIDKRAKNMLEATSDISTPNAAVRFVKDLSNYTGDVKAMYNKVKVRATHSSKAGNFEFDYDEIAIDPILEELGSKITDPNVMNRFLLQAQRIKTMTESRSFADLIELRQITNDFLFNKNISKADSRNMLRGVVDRIDDMITQGAADVVDDPKQWLDDWATAKSEYSKMKKMEQTAMHRLIFDKYGNVKPVTPESVTKAMSKYLTTLDGNFEALLDELPKQSRDMYEGAIIDTLARKYTIGYSSEKQAVHFPALAEDLQKLKFLSPAARATKDALLEMSEIFKNDLPLALTNSSFKVPSFQSYLTTDPVVRAKYEIASGVFNYVKTLAPTQEQRANALIRKTSKLLEEPLNAKTANEIIEEFRNNPEVLKQISQLQRDTAYARAQGRDATAARVRIFEGGKYKGSGEPIAKIGRHRIASVEVVKQIADSEAISVNSSMLDSILKQHGYAAVENGTDRVRLLK